MPSNFLTADTSFPNLNEEQSTDEKFRVMTDYLFMLLEQLRYTLANLGEENFNDTALHELGTVITEPLFVQLEKMEETLSGAIERVTSFEVKAGEISATVEQLETSLSGDIETVKKDVSGVSQTAEQIKTTVESLTLQTNTLNKKINTVEQNMSTVTQTATKLETTVLSLQTDTDALSGELKTVKLNVSDVQQTADAISVTVAEVVSKAKAAEANASAAVKTASLALKPGDISLSVSDNDGASASIVLGLGVDEDGNQITRSGTITMTGVVTFAALGDSSDITAINGAKITTGELEACTLRSIASNTGGYSGSVELCAYNSGLVFGRVHADYGGAGTDTENVFRMIIETNETDVMGVFIRPALKLKSCDSLSIEANTDEDGTVQGLVYISGKNVQLDSTEEVYLHPSTMLRMVSDGNIWMNGNTVLIEGSAAIHLNGNVYVNGNLIS